MAGFRALFLAYDSANTQRLWVTDGTDAGTFPLSVPGLSSSVLPNLQHSVPFGNGLLFSATDPSLAGQLFMTDGTVAGTTAIPASGAAASGPTPFNIYAFGNTVYFSGASAQTGGAIWSMLGGGASTSVLVNSHITPTSFASAGGSVFCNGYLPGTLTVGLYRLDAGPSATPLSIPDVSEPDDLMGFGNLLLFRGTSGGTPGLFAFDTGTGGLTQLKSASGDNLVNPAHLTLLNGLAYFEAETSVGTLAKLWRSDGTTAGTAPLSLPGIKALSAQARIDSQYAELGGRLLLSAIDSSNKIQLFATDGAAGGTTEIIPAGAAAQGIQPTGIAAAAGTGLFTGVDSTNKRDLFVVDGTTFAATKLAPASAGNAFGFLGLSPTFETAFSVACFASGTRIATPAGEMPVGHLAAGQWIRTRPGAAPIVWVGHRTVDCARHPRPADVCPVRVLAGAFAPGAPARDLLLSPDHAVFLPDIDGGVLVPVRYLTNGATVAQEQAAKITYWHIELAQHDVVFADGLACESYLDTGNRAAFVDGGPAMQMHPDFALRIWNNAACVPLVRDGHLLAHAKAQVLHRALRLGHRLAAVAGPQLLIGGKRFSASSINGAEHRFNVRAPAAKHLRIVSPGAIPEQVCPGAADGRRLGVMLQRISLFRPWTWEDLPLGALGGQPGWHALEGAGGQEWRWTDGDALVPLPAGRDGVLAVNLTVAAVQPAWQPRARRSRLSQEI